MSVFVAEFIGTALLILLGNGVVANVLLPKSKGHGGGWIVITSGWAIGVFLGVYITSGVSGGHLNPVVTFSMAYLGRLSWQMVPVYLLAQFTGAFTGSVATWLMYKKHFDMATQADHIQAIFCTAPAIRHFGWNFMTEMLATFSFMLGVLYLAASKSDMGSLQALPVALLVLGMGLSLGGPTGYAINPARDFGPRIAHYLLPIAHKGTSDWEYAWVPIVGPFTGGALATMVYHFLSNSVS